MRRRFPLLITVMGLIAVVHSASEVARAQQRDVMPRVGVIGSRSAAAEGFQRFVRGLRDLGYADGNSIILETRFSHARPELYGLLAAELVRLKVDAIVASGERCEAVIALTQTIPIVCPGLRDPVGRGLIASFARPGGNVTGIASFSAEQFHKSFQILKEAIPTVRRITVLWLTNGEWLLREAKTATDLLDIELHSAHIGRPADIDSAFQAAARERIEAVAATQGPFFGIHRERIAELGRRHGLPTMANEIGFAAAGGLLEFGPDIAANWARAAYFVGRILKGARPAELPVEQPAPKLVVNLKTAKALGIAIPQSILLRATEVIE